MLISVAEAVRKKVCGKVGLSQPELKMQTLSNIELCQRCIQCTMCVMNLEMKVLIL